MAISAASRDHGSSNRGNGGDNGPGPGSPGNGGGDHGMGPICKPHKVFKHKVFKPHFGKKHVFGQVAIDCIAGPSEIVVLADETAKPEFVAADLIAQAEHSPGASFLVTWCEQLLQPVLEALERQLSRLPRGQLARDSLESFGALILTANEAQAVEWVNRIAPEHLHIQTANAQKVSDCIDNAGAIVNENCPVAEYPAVSFIDTENVNGPAAVGVPERLPLFETLSPGGRPVADAV